MEADAVTSSPFTNALEMINSPDEYDMETIDTSGEPAEPQSREFQSCELEIMQINFLDDFKDQYQRNSKAKGRKHLRCFPTCRPQGHIDNSYCGTPVRVAVTYRADPKQNHQNVGSHLISYAEFRPQVNAPAIVPGKCAQEIGQHWMPGIFEPSSVLPNGLCVAVVAFNSQNKSWPYLWQSHRMTANTPHVMDIFVGRKASSPPLGASFSCSGASHSTPFRIYCRKK